MTDFQVNARARLGPNHKPTGRTRHYTNGVLNATPLHLAIGRYPDVPGYYLLYLDQHGEELNDTYHDTIEAAMRQAQWEFSIKPCDWEVLDG
jgi:hypothetical protein